MAMTLVKRFIAIAIILLFAVAIVVRVPVRLGLDLNGGASIVLALREDGGRPVTTADVMGVMDVIQNRVNALGLTEPVIQSKGLNQILVELPGIDDMDRALSLIGETAKLVFYEADWAPQRFEQLTQADKDTLLGPNAQVSYLKQTLSDGTTVMRGLILKNPVIQGNQLAEAFPGTDNYGQPMVNIVFDDEATSIFYDVTTRHVGRPLAILLDDTPISAPNINEPISGGRAVISGSFTTQEVKDLVIKLRAGSLPVPVDIVSYQLVGPSLGTDVIAYSKKAAIIGVLAVAIYMIVFFRLFGALAIVALIYYACLTFSVLKIMDATLTLPGIAGLILTLGMAVDANIIIFSRIRDELERGDTLLSAIDSGFSKSFLAILDANVTTIFAAMVLFWLGTGAIKGFAITLTVGVLSSMMSALVVTRFLIQLLMTVYTGPKSWLMKGVSHD